MLIQQKKSQCPHAACRDDAVLTFSLFLFFYPDIQASGIVAGPPARKKQTPTAMLILMPVKAQRRKKIYYNNTHEVADFSSDNVASKHCCPMTQPANSSREAQEALWSDPALPFTNQRHNVLYGAEQPTGDLLPNRHE